MASESPTLDLQIFVTALLETNRVIPMALYIHEFTLNPNDVKKHIFNSLSFYHPDSFSLKLATLLSSEPPYHIRNQAVLFLKQTLDNDDLTIRYDTLVQLKTLVLEFYKIEIYEDYLPPIASAIAYLAGRIYAFPSRSWLELLEYVVSCVTSKSDGSVLNQRKGLLLLAELPPDISEHKEFWKDHYSDLCKNLVARMLDGTADESSKTLVFDSLSTMLLIAQPLEEYEIGGSILLMLLDRIDRHSDEEVLLGRFLDLADFVSENVDQVLKGKEGNVFQVSLRIAEKNGTSMELKCAAVKVLEGLVENSRLFITKLSDVDARRVIKVSLEMMFESDAQCFELGKSLLKWLSFKKEEEESLVFPMIMDFLKSTYSASKDLKKRHTVIMVVLARFAVENISDDGSLFATEIIKMIADEINHIISIITECWRAQEAGTSEGGSEHLSDEEIIQSSRLLITTTIKAFKHRLGPGAEELFSTISQLWGNDFPDRMKAIAFSFMNMIGPHFPDILQIYHDRYTYELLKAMEGSLHAQETARGIAICATYGGQKFKTIVNEAIFKLYSLIGHGHSIKGEEPRYGANISEMAVAALGMVCEFHRENVDARPEVIRNWLSFLPLNDNLNLAKNAHGQLSKMLQRKDADVLGPNKENLPKIISIFRAILLRPDELATEETCSEIIVFLDEHGGDL